MRIKLLGPSGVKYLLKLPSREIRAKHLIKAAELMTRIPFNKQMLFYRDKLIDPNSSIKLEHDSPFHIQVKGVGGGGDSDKGK